MVKRIVAGHLINVISQCTDICQGTVHLKKALLRSLTSPADIQKKDNIYKNLRKKCINSHGKISRQKCVNHQNKNNLVSTGIFVENILFLSKRRAMTGHN